MELPNNAELCKQVFLAQTKSHLTKYAEKHRVVETEILKLQEFFEGCHNTVIHGGEYKRIKEAKMKAKEHGEPKKEEHCAQDKSQQGHSDHRDYRGSDRYQYHYYK